MGRRRRRRRRRRRIRRRRKAEGTAREMIRHKTGVNKKKQ